MRRPAAPPADAPSGRPSPANAEALRGDFTALTKINNEGWLLAAVDGDPAVCLQSSLKKVLSLLKRKTKEAAKQAKANRYINAKAAKNRAEGDPPPALLPEAVTLTLSWVPPEEAAAFVAELEETMSHADSDSWSHLAWFGASPSEVDLREYDLRKVSGFTFARPRVGKLVGRAKEGLGRQGEKASAFVDRRVHGTKEAASRRATTDRTARTVPTT